MINDEWWFSVSACTLNGYPVLVSTTNFKHNLLVSMVNSSSHKDSFMTMSLSWKKKKKNKGEGCLIHLKCGL